VRTAAAILAAFRRAPGHTDWDLRGVRAHTRGMRPRQQSSRPRPATSPFRSEPTPERPEYAVDDRVTHDRHGLGRVVRLDGDRVDVRFGSQTVSVAVTSPRLHSL